MIYKLVSVRRVIAKVLSDLDIAEESVRISDWISWAGEAIEKIGAVSQLAKKVSGVDGEKLLELKSGQAQLPSSLFRLNQAAYSMSETGPWSSMSIATSSFGVHVPKKTSSIGSIGQTNSSTNVPYPNGVKYTIKPGYIVVNMDDGFIKLSYDAIPIDSDGYPLIPDLASYSEALYWYITMKLKYPEYMSGKMNREIYYDMRRSWNFYCKQAYAEAIMPTIDEMESIKNSWLRLIPEIDEQDTFFETTGDRQYIKNFNKNH